MTKIIDIYNKLNSDYPFSEQEDWDNSGILCGDSLASVSVCVTTLDVTDDAIETAIKYGAELIISHHPIIFRPVKNISARSSLFKAIKNNITVISAHTNFDKAYGGTNDIFCNILGFKSEKTDGGILNICENCFDGNVEQLSEFIAKRFHCAVTYSLPLQKVNKIAVCTGSGADELDFVYSNKADCFITGEMSYHIRQSAEEKGVAVITTGHFESENPAIKILNDRLALQFPEVNFINYSPDPPFKTIISK